MSQLQEAKRHTIQGLSRISHFWGFPKAMGAIFGAVYLSPDPVSLDQIVEQVGVSKGTVSTNIRYLERLGMVHKHIEIGERKDYYTAETDFWKIVKGILREREQSEFDQALRTVTESLEWVENSNHQPGEAELAAFYQARLRRLSSFFQTLDNIVAALLALDEFRISALEKLIGKGKSE